MPEFEKIYDNIYRLCIPFEDLFTSVFLIDTEGGAMLIDSGDNANDVNTYILPAVRSLGADVRMLAFTHLHGDHAGGARRLAEVFCNAAICAYSDRIKEIFAGRSTLVLREGDMLLSYVRILQLAGHSRDSIGFLDTRSNILIGGDAVQLYGISRYGCGLGSPSEYIKTLKRLRLMPLAGYIASHDYFPLGAFSGADTAAYFDEAQRDYNRIAEFVKANMHLADANAIAEAFTEENRRTYVNFPKLNPGTVKAIIEELEK